MNYNNVSALYDFLASNNVSDLGPKTEFLNKINDRSKREALYSFLNKNGVTDMGGDIDEFEAKLGIQSTTINPDWQFATTPYDMTQMTLKALNEEREKSKPVQASVAPKWSDFERGTASAVIEHNAEGVKKRLEEARKPLAGATPQGVDGFTQAWDDRNAVGQMATRNPILNGSDLIFKNIEQGNIGKDEYAFLNGQRKQATARIDAIINEAEQMLKENPDKYFTTSEGLQSTVVPTAEGVTLKGVINDLKRVKRRAEKTITKADMKPEMGQIQRYVGVYQETPMYDAGEAGKALLRGLGEADAINTLSGGLKDMVKDLNFAYILDKANQGQQLSAEENLYLQLLGEQEKLEDILKMGGGETGFYKVGKGIAESAPYWTGMLLTSGIAAPVKASAEGLIKATANRGLKQFAQKATSKLIGSAAAAAATTPLQAGMWDNYAKNTINEWMENGGIRSSKANRLWKGFADAFTDVFTEHLGGIITQSAKYAFPKIGVEAVLARNNSSGFVKDLLKRVEWGGTLGEFEEEMLAGVLSPLVRGASKEERQQEYRELVKKENLWTTLMTTALMGAGFKAMQAPEAGIQIAKYSSARRKANNSLKNIQNLDLRQQVYDALQLPTMKQTAEALSKINWGAGNVEQSDIGHALDYAYNAMQKGVMDGAYIAEEANKALAVVRTSLDAVQRKGMVQTANVDGKPVYILGDVQPESPNAPIVVVRMDGTKEQVPMSSLKDVAQTSVDDVLATLFADKVAEVQQQEAVDNKAQDIEDAREAGVTPAEDTQVDELVEGDIVLVNGEEGEIIAIDQYTGKARVKVGDRSVEVSVSEMQPATSESASIVPPTEQTTPPTEQISENTNTEGVPTTSQKIEPIRDKDGKVDYNAMGEEQTATYVGQTLGERALGWVEGQITTRQQALEKEQKEKSLPLDIDEAQKAIANQQANIERLQQEIAMWEGVKNRLTAPATEEVAPQATMEETTTPVTEEVVSEQSQPTTEVTEETAPVEAAEEVSPAETASEETATPIKGEATEQTTEQATPSEAPKAAEWSAGLVRDENTPNRADLDIFDALAKAMGVRLVFSPDVNENGYYDAGTKTIYVATDVPVRFITGHEFLHRMRDIAPDAYDKFKASVVDFLGAIGFRAEKARVRKLYAKALKQGRVRRMPTKEVIEEEVVADFAGELIARFDIFQQFVERHKYDNAFLRALRSVMQHIRNFFKGRKDPIYKDVKSCISLLNELIEASAKAIGEGVDTAYAGTTRYALRGELGVENLHKAAATIHKWMENNTRNKSFTLELPTATTRKVRQVMGRDFDSHNITANGIAHAYNNHGENGKKLTEKSIPIRKEDLELIPYIMTAPSYVDKGSTKNGRDSVRYYKNISNGYVVVIEKELDNSADDLETINMWAELSDVSNASKTLNRTSETPTISRSDVAKIRKDAENAIVKERNMRNSLRGSAKSLVGMHNLSLEKLEKVIKMGGLANPSVAILDVDKSDHEDYGDYSLILTPNIVDAKLGRNAGTWAGDAWTPTYPPIVKRIAKSADIARFFKDISKMPETISNRVRLDWDSFLEGRSAAAMAYWFLFDKGVAPELQHIPAKYPESLVEQVSTATNGSFSLWRLSPEQRAACVDAYIAYEYNGNKEEYETDLQEKITRLQKFAKSAPREIIRKKAEQDLADIEEYGFDYDKISDFVRDVERDYNNKGKVDVDGTIRTAQEYIEQNNLQEDFDTWKEDVQKRYGVGEYIFNGYTNSGDRRWLLHTLENASKWMKQQGREGSVATFPSFGVFVATVIPRMTSLESIRKRKNLLGKDKQEFEDFKEKWEKIYFELGNKLQPDAKSFEDYGWWRLIEAVGTKNPQAHIKQQYGIELSEEDATKLNELVDAIRTNYPARYFETKFERPLQLNDFTAAVVPSTIPADVEKALRSAYLDVYKYDKEVEGSRREATLEATDKDYIRFSLRDNAPFYSNAEFAVRNIKQEKATPEQWLKMIEKNGGLKAGEDKWLGLSDWLKESKAKTLTKQEVLDYINSNKIVVEDVEYGVQDYMSENEIYESDEYRALEESLLEYEDETPYIDKEKFKELRNKDEDFVDGFDVDYWGEQLLVKNPFAAARYLGISNVGKRINETRLAYTTSGLDNKREIALVVPTIEPYKQEDEVHFGDAGDGRAVAWVRFGETTDAYGLRVLVIDEIQSNRHQEGREKGYFSKDVAEAEKQLNELYSKIYTSGVTAEEHNRMQALREFLEENKGEVPEAPFEKNWHEVAMKRILRYAAENGYDKVAWTTGNQQAERYSIGGAVESIDKQDSYNADEQNFKVTLKATESPLYLTTNNEGVVVNTLAQDYMGKNLSDIFGKEIAVKMLGAKENSTISGDGLRIGGEGMRAFYDQILPNFMNKYGKKWGVKVGEVTMPDLAENNTMHSVAITPAMRESVMQGQPLFSLRLPGYQERFKALTEEYNALDKNDAKALADFRARKRTLVDEYWNDFARALGADVDARAIDSTDNPEVLRPYYDMYIERVRDGRIEDEEKTFEEFVEDYNKDEDMIAGHICDSNIVFIDMAKTDKYTTTKAFTRFFIHEYAHVIIEGKVSEQELIDIWNENANTKFGKTLKGKYDDESPAELGDEVLAYTVSGIGNADIRPLLNYIEGDEKVSENDVLKVFGNVLPLNAEKAKQLLKIIKNGYREKGAGAAQEGTQLLEKGESQLSTWGGGRRPNGEYSAGETYIENGRRVTVIDEDLSTVEDLPEFDESPRNSLRDLEDELTYHNLSAMNKTSRKILKVIQDNMVDISRLQEALKQAGVPINDSNDFYNAIDTASSKAQYRYDEYFKKYAEPLLAFMSDLERHHKVTYDEINDYLLAKHSIERHGSGLDALNPNDDAVWGRNNVEKIVADFEAKVPADEVDRLWAMINTINDRNLDILLQGGIKTPADIEMAKSHNWKYYVPLKEWAWEDEGFVDPSEYYDTMVGRRNGKVSGKWIEKAAKGRTSKPSNPLPHIFMAGSKAFRFVEQNKAMIALYNLLLDANERLGDTVKGSWTISERFYVRAADGAWEEKNAKDIPADEFDAYKAEMKAIANLSREMRKAYANARKLEAVGNMQDALLERMRGDNLNTEIKNRKANLNITIENPQAYHPNERMAFGKREFDKNREVGFYVNGKYITIEFTNSRYPAAINKVSEVKMRSDNPFFNNIIKGTRWATRFKSKTSTTYNPAFMLTNFLRDAGFASYVHLVDKEHGNFLGYISALGTRTGAINRGLKGTADPLSSVEMGNLNLLNKGDRAILTKKYGINRVNDSLFKWFLENGAPMGFSFMKDTTNLEKELRKKLRSMRGKYSAKQQFYNALPEFLQWAERMSQNVELSNRFATFVASLDKGESVGQAVSNSRNFTLNFNKKGDVTGIFSALHAFFNPFVQGLAQFAKVSAKNWKRSVPILTAIGTLGYLVSMVIDEAWGDDGDDDQLTTRKVADWLKRGYLVIPMSQEKGSVIRIPLPQHIRTFFAFGSALYDYQSGKLDGEGLKADLANAFLTDFSYGFTEGGDWIRTIIPSASQPLWDLKVNKDAWGREIYRESDVYPNSEMGKRNTSKWAKDTAKALNTLSGGDKYTSGRIDINPDVLQYLVEQSLGGAGTFGRRTKEFFESLPKDSRVEFELQNIPMIGSLMYTVNPDGGYEEYSKYQQEFNNETSGFMKKRYNDGYIDREEYEKYLAQRKVFTRLKNNLTKPYSDILNELEYNTDAYDSVNYELRRMRNLINRVMNEINWDNINAQEVTSDVMSIIDNYSPDYKERITKITSDYAKEK